MATQDGGYLLGGDSNSPVSGDKSQPDWDSTCNFSDYWVVKIDSVGNKLWDKRFGGAEAEYLNALFATTDSGFILVGGSASGISGDKTQPNWDTTDVSMDYWMVKINSTGQKIWDKRLGGTDQDEPYCVIKTLDLSYIFAGDSYSPLSGDKTQVDWGIGDYWIVKTDSLGNKLWDKRYGGNDLDYMLSIQNTTDGGYLLAGNSRSNISGDKTENNLGFTQTWVLKVDSTGNKLWDKTIFTPESDYGYILPISNGCYAIANSSGVGIAGYKTQNNWSDSSSNYWFVMFCDSAITSINSLTFATQFNVYPNPFTSELDISIAQTNLKQADFSICNILGQTVYTQHETNLSPTYTKMLDLSYLPNGVYLVEVVVDGEVSVREVVKQ